MNGKRVDLGRCVKWTSTREVDHAAGTKLNDDTCYYLCAQYAMEKS